MPPNTIDTQFQNDPENQYGAGNKSGSTAELLDRSDENYKLKIFHSSLNILTHTLIGAVTGISLFYAFRNGIPLGATPLHIVLCVVGVSVSISELCFCLRFLAFV